MSLPGPDPAQTVVVTGASAGIGAAIATELAARGYGLSLVARRRKELEAFAEVLRCDHDVEVSVHRVDLAKDGARRRLLKELADDRRDVVGLCNNAGVAAIGTFWRQPPSDEVHLVRLNVLASHELTAELVGAMVTRGTGAILNVSSILAFAPFPGNLTYAATKAFMQSFSEGLHEELAGTGVSCTAVFPGPTRTDAYDTTDNPQLRGFGPGLLWMDAEEVATASVTAMINGRRTVTPGWTNRAAGIVGRLTPRVVLLPAIRMLSAERLKRLSDRFLIGESGPT